MTKLAALMLLMAATLSAALPKPESVSVSTRGPVPVLSWTEVEGAAMYRVAVFAAPDDEGKRELMAAVWVKGSSWAYGSGKVLAKAGKLPSTTPKKLEMGIEYKVMISAADAKGLNKSEWASSEFGAGEPESTTLGRQVADSSPASALSATTTPTPTPSPTPALDAAASTGTAELEIDLAAEFKESPQAGEVGLTKTSAPATLESARALLQQGKAEDAETAYKALLAQDSNNADLWEGLGDSYDARKMRVEAKEAYENALAIDKKRERLNKWMQENVKR